ncbi:MAG: NAD-dependent epimerase/dehydratase family protein [Streptosporangiales bacterium]|nr:NAD-dependent epimerase/dehydratase family protein [Streptosporangiales bacterium]
MTQDPSQQRVLVTGAAGGIGRVLRPRLAREGRLLRLLDVAGLEPTAAGENVEVVVASVTDLHAMRAACAGVDAVIHLAAIPGEAAWEDILATNIDGTRCVIEAARLAGVGRIVLASSNHAAGFWARDEAPPEGLPADAFPRPDTYYGVSKAVLEALGSLYHHRFGMDVICLRIGSCLPRPHNARALATWLSHDDTGRLFEACLSAPRPGFRVVWGISRNTRRWWSLEAGEELDYHPVDDSEGFAAEVLAGTGEPDLRDPVHRLVGGEFCSMPLGVAP